MNKRMVSIFGSVFLVFGFTLTSCDFLDVLNSHDHTYSSSYEYNETYHWHPSTCGHDVKGDEERHEFTSETNENGDTVYTCSICHYSYSDRNNDDKDTYTVTWKNYDGTILEIDNDVESGTIPTYDGETPSREGNDMFTYVFSGWQKDGELVLDASGQAINGFAVFNDIVLIASFDEIPNGTLIHTIEELKAIEMEGSYILANDLVIPSDEIWIPLGNDSKPFSGSFNGNGHTIFGLDRVTLTNRQGLFGTMEGADVRNLKLEETTLDASGVSDDNYASADGFYAGAICAYASDTSFTNCFVSGRVSMSPDYRGVGYSHVSIAPSYFGMMIGYGKDLIVHDCGVEGRISFYGCSSAAVGGGFIGHSEGGEFVNCGSEVDVSVSLTYSYNQSVSVGGFSGKNNSGTYLSVYATGDVRGDSSSSSGYRTNSDVGGLIGYDNNGTISQSYVENENVTSTIHVSNVPTQPYSYTADVGGMIGEVHGTNASDCYAKGDVSATTDTSSSIAGGFIGVIYFAGKFENCYASGSVYSENTSKPAKSKMGIRSGGFAGYDRSGADCSYISCYASGNLIKANSSSNIIYDGGVAGGINGAFYDATNCYRPEEQQFLFMKGFDYDTTPYDGGFVAIPFEEILSVVFQKEVLGYDETIWSFAEGEYPTLKNCGPLEQ